jgi:hypothetical protein
LNGLGHVRMAAKLLKISKTSVPRVFQAQIGWKHIGERRIYFRSKWEWQYAVYLEFTKDRQIIQGWEYEPQTFWFEKIKRGVRSYKPDFKVIENDGSHYWAEVKGYMDTKSLTKIRRFKKFYPKEKLVVIDQKWFVSNHCLLDSVVKMNKQVNDEHSKSKEGNGR